MSTKQTDYLLLFILAVIWSASFLLIKIAVNTIPPFTLTAGRLTIAAIILSIFLVLRKQRIPLNARAILIYCVVGILGNSIPFVLISTGEIHISSSLTAILMGIMPISTFLLAHFFIVSESITPRKIVGVICGFSGLMTLVGFTSITSENNLLIGQLLVLGGALCYSVTTIFVRKQPIFQGHLLATGVNIFGAVFSLILAFVFEQPLSIKPSQDALLALITLGIFPTAIASILYFRIVKNLGATTFSQINYMIPVMGGFGGVLFLNESLRWNMFFALAMVLVGIYLIQSNTTSAKKLFQSSV